MNDDHRLDWLSEIARNTEAVRELISLLLTTVTATADRVEAATTKMASSQPATWPQTLLLALILWRVW